MLYLQHVLRNADGTFGPTGYQSAPSFVQRMINSANMFAKGTGFQFFVQEVRNDPAK